MRKLRLTFGIKHGFTLIELSIVLVIIGLIIGGVLVGRDLISAAGVRAQISQIEKYGTAVRTFQSKYGYLPGDMPDPTATQYGFATRGTSPGEGDGNGQLSGIGDPCTTDNGENALFWVDLTQAKLLNGGFSTATPTAAPVNITSSQFPLYFPPAVIGQGGYVYVYGDDTGNNYFGVSSFSNPFVGSVNQYGTDYPNGLIPTITVAQAYAIDKKIDDGLPGTGRITTATWGSMFGFYNGQVPDAQSFSPDATTCYDGTYGGAEEYTMSVNSGAGMNCAVSFKFQ